jgi:anaerobic ribonucleoside-triphosphate reductase activating protein
MRNAHRKPLCRPDALNVAHQVERCTVLGPGTRYIVWVQGCPLHCPGCHNSQFLPFIERQWLPVDELARQICNTAGIEGVTFVGGEPAAQAVAVAAVARHVRQGGLSVLVYSGYSIEELRGEILPGTAALLENIDLLMDGRYRRDMPTLRPWRGSDNQRLIALSPRYSPQQVESWNQPTGQQFEVRITAGGTLEFLGIPPVLQADGVCAEMASVPKSIQHDSPEHAIADMCDRIDIRDRMES